MEKTSNDLAQELADLETQLKEAIGNQAVVQEDYNKIKKNIIEMEAIRFDKKIKLDKARFLCSQLRSAIRIKEQEFWSTKNSGL